MQLHYYFYARLSGGNMDGGGNEIYYISAYMHSHVGTPPHFFLYSFDVMKLHECECVCVCVCVCVCARVCVYVCVFEW